jgi:hypothetical protein
LNLKKRRNVAQLFYNAELKKIKIQVSVVTFCLRCFLSTQALMQKKFEIKIKKTEIRISIEKRRITLFDF